MTSALLSLGFQYPAVRETVSGSLTTYIRNCIQALGAIPSVRAQEITTNRYGEYQEAAEIASIAVSLVGFLEAAAAHAHFWTSLERLELIRQLQNMLAERFLVTVETASSTIRNAAGSDNIFRDWKRYSKRYAADGRPIGAMLLQQGFMRFVVACTSLLVADVEIIQQGEILDQHMSGVDLVKTHDGNIDDAMIEYLTDIITDAIRLLEDGSDYLQIGSAWQRHLAFSVKASALTAFLNCMVLDEEIADVDLLLLWLEDTLANEVQMADEGLATVVLKGMAVAAKSSPESASILARSLLRFIVSGASRSPIVAVAAHSLSHILRILSQDAVITTLYSLGNVLSSGGDRVNQSSTTPENGTNNHHSSLPYSNPKTGSVISLSLTGDEETSTVCGNVSNAIVTIANSSNDPKITALAQPMLLQKIGRVNATVDAKIIEQAAALAVSGREAVFKTLVKLYSRLAHDSILQENQLIGTAVANARDYLAVHIDKESPLFRVYLKHLLENIANKGDVIEDEARHPSHVEHAAREIALLLKPLALLVSTSDFNLSEQAIDDEEELSTMFRETWFNLAVHGISLQSKIGQQHYQELRVLATHSESLAARHRAELLESDVDLNTILRRGMNAQHMAEQKRQLSSVLPDRESDVRRLSYPKVIFLNAVYLLESLRAVSGNVSRVLDYFLDPALRTSEMGSCLTSIVDEVVKMYLDKTVTGQYEEFSAPHVSRQLADFLAGCCHRMEKVQQVAVRCANRLILATPSSLCQKSALFALLEILTLMWSSCLEAEIDEYDWRSVFTSARGKVTVELSDNYTFRKRTLNVFYAEAKRWLTGVMSIAPLDVKGLLQTYLSEYDDTGSYGHVALGRSFALEMGSLIPPNDQRLVAIDRQGENCNINVASDFMAQYTTRQEYRYADPPEHDPEWFAFMHANDKADPRTPKGPQVTEQAESVLRDLESRIVRGKYVTISEVRDVLRRAAALLCTSKKAQCAIVHHLVVIPIEIFTKASIKLGVALWLGVIHENPRMESRIVNEVAEAWERTIHRKVGVFGAKLEHPDPFYIKEEFAPSDKQALLKQLQAAQSILSPHFRVLQFLESHFNAIRLGSSHTQRTFIRTISATLIGLRDTAGHPLAREFHFHVVLLGLNMLRNNTTLTKEPMWRFKDQILSAALSWFRHPLRWSFGGNRLQVKAEIQVMTDVINSLSAVANIGMAISVARKTLQPKQELLLMLLQSEISRLSVWLYPLSTERKPHGVLDATLAPLMRTAWTENPGLAIQLATRFPSDKLRNDVRWLLLNFPERAVSHPDGLELLLGSSLPGDIWFQLKYLLYWAPVNPMTAVTYFLPAYGNHPFIIQYAMRALESHSVDVTFFYVPQIVQCLRYDVLRYVERYIVETGNFSQLFAHQIIWNMKANAYKDEDSQEPDPVKPVLDKVMQSLISSFSREDKDFYEREFAFFNEITDISGKLRPFIKKTKPEKKAKIEEELRKIKVEIGVYLPSNPDGVVIGIDRKSGKPLQSHAKAPYMATFRIRKPTNKDQENGSDMIEQAPKHEHRRRASGSDLSVRKQAGTYEVWQSAIFKVGDDCRQDVLALQLIAAFRGIFNNVGLDVYVYPYRVTATAPGCGVIDVLPNSISRDMLGREAVNGLFDYFVTKYGGEDSIRFQEARNNFVKSMAAYSVISYLLQFKDRHNGNIMVDDDGHILHIDFGFCFDIVPGGVRFERAPFKLTSEMIAVMGGDSNSQAYQWFEELTVKAFLASRQYIEKLKSLVVLMLDSGLPCFKPQTIQHFEDRFVMHKNEREAAEFMKVLVRKSHNAYSTRGYDQFQLMTNGIPY